MKFVKDLPGMLLFSLECAGCKVEMLSTANGPERSIWSMGAAHVFQGDTTQSNFKAELTSSDVDIGVGGRI